MILIGYKRIFKTEEAEQAELMTVETLPQNDEIPGKENSFSDSEETALTSGSENSEIEKLVSDPENNKLNAYPDNESTLNADLKKEESRNVNSENNKTDIQDT